MPKGTENSRNFQISGKSDNLERLTKVFEMNFAKISVPFDSVPNFRNFWLNGKRPRPLMYSNTYNNLQIAAFVRKTEKTPRKNTT